MRLRPSTTRTPFCAAVVLVLLPLGAGCEDDESYADAGGGAGGGDADGAVDEESRPVGPPSGATCPDDAGMLTYEEFGKPFVERYCVHCHSSELEGAARNGAPEGHNFDSLAGILLVAAHVDQMAASGPSSTNETMPWAGEKPSKAERELLGQWLACEAQ